MARLRASWVNITCSLFLGFTLILFFFVPSFKPYSTYSSFHNYSEIVKDTKFSAVDKGFGKDVVRGEILEVAPISERLPSSKYYKVGVGVFNKNYIKSQLLQSAKSFHLQIRRHHLSIPIVLRQLLI